MRVSFLIRYGLVFAASLSIAACGIGGGGSASITTQPVNQSVTAGQTATFSVTVTTTGTLDGNTLSGPGSTDFFVTRYDSSGQKQYTRQLGVSADPFINALSTMGKAVVSDARGNVFVTGDTTGGLDGNTLTGTTDFFLTKYDSSGVKQ